MKAWRLHNYGDLRLEDIPIPEIPPRWVLVKVKVVQAQTEVGFAKGTPPNLSHPFIVRRHKNDAGGETYSAGS